MKKIGILGAAFNPIHIGHLILGQEAVNKLNLDSLLLVPTKNPYHKSGELLPYEDRLKLTVDACKDNDKFIVSDIEKDFEGASYTFDLIRSLKDREDADYYFILGADSLINLDTWYRFEELLPQIKLVVFSRPGYFDIENLLKRYRKYTEIFYFDQPKIEISSTDIRSRVKNGLSLKYLLRDSTISCIEKEGFYRAYDFEDIKKKLEKTLKKSRYEHTLRVVDEALYLNKELKLNLDEKKVKLAALLHDCAKHNEVFYFEKLKDIAGLDRTILDKDFDAHEKLAPYVSKFVYGVDDEEICQAIAGHTKGRVNMSALDKLIYLADYIEPGRNFEGLDDIKAKMSRGLNETLLKAMDINIEFLKKNRDFVDEVTIEARNSVLKEILDGKIGDSKEGL